MIETIMAVLFGCMFLMAMGGFVLQHIFLGRLKNDHPQTWEKLGRPTLILKNSIANSLAIWRFIQRDEYESLADEKFIKFVCFMKWYHRTYFVIFGTFLVLFCVRLWSR